MFYRQAMRYIKMLLAGWLMVGCVACGPSLQSLPSMPRSLAGNWVADAARCEAIETQLHSALDAAREKELGNANKRARRHTNDQPSMDPHMGPDAWEVRDQREQYQALFEVVRPLTDLNIVQEHGQIIFSSSHAAQRNFEPGINSTLVTTFANLRIESGWQKEEFVVYSKDSKTDIEIYERYRIRSDGSLLLSVTLSVKYMDTQQYTLVYHQSKAA